MDILKYNKTFTTKFILPLLFKQNTDYSDIFNNSFINAYIGDIRNKEYDDKVLLVFGDYPSISITQQLPQSIAEYMDDEKYVLVYDIEDKYIEDYNNFIVGKYNLFNNETKTKIKKFWQVDKDSLIASVLDNNTQKIREYLKSKKSKKTITEEDIWFAPIIKHEILGVS